MVRQRFLDLVFLGLAHLVCPAAAARAVYVSADGSCRTLGGNQGSFDEHWQLTKTDCASLCTLAGEVCVAYEHGSFKTYTRCKLHKVPITHTLPLPGASCHVKDMPKLRDAFQIPSDPPSAAGARAHSPPPASPLPAPPPPAVKLRSCPTAAAVSGGDCSG